MFPPATPTTERIRADMENREITQRAALLAGVSQPRRLSFFRRLLNGLRRTPTLPTQPVRPASSVAKNA